MASPYRKIFIFRECQFQDQVFSKEFRKRNLEFLGMIVAVILEGFSSLVDYAITPYVHALIYLAEAKVHALK